MSNYGNDQSESLLNENSVGSAPKQSLFEQPSITGVISQDSDDHAKTVSTMSIGKRLFANLIPSTAYQPLKIPFPEDEHYCLSSESVFYINDKYLSSIVAFTLSSKEYKEFQSIASKIELAKLNQQASISIYSSPTANKDTNLNLINSALQEIGKLLKNK